MRWPGTNLYTTQRPVDRNHKMGFVLRVYANARNSKRNAQAWKRFTRIWR